MKIHFYGLTTEEKMYLDEKTSFLPSDMEMAFSTKDLAPVPLPEKRDADIVSVFIDSKVSKEVIDAFPNLKFIATRSTGFDHIDVSYAQGKGIAVSNVPSYGENTVAEHAFGLMLALAHRIYDGYRQVRESGSFSQAGLQGFDLKGKTLGVVGTGRIGCHAVKIAKGFGMSVLAFDAFPNEELARRYGFKYKSFEEVLSESDIITIHVPYTKETHHLFDSKALRTMKRGSYLINTSRGGVVDTEALVQVLEGKHLAGAGLDVLEEEGVIADELEFLRSKHPEEHNLRAVLANHVLIDMPNVIITPHNAFNTKESIRRILDTTIENIGAFVEGRPINEVSR